MCQRADLPIAKQPCNFGNRQRLVMEIALGEGGPQLVQYLREGSTLLAKLARQSSQAHPEPPRNFRVTAQQFVEAFIASHNRKQGNRLRKAYLVGVSAKFDVNAEECSKFRR